MDRRTRTANKGAAKGGPVRSAILTLDWPSLFALPSVPRHPKRSCIAMAPHWHSLTLDIRTCRPTWRPERAHGPVGRSRAGCKTWYSHTHKRAALPQHRLPWTRMAVTGLPRADNGHSMTNSGSSSNRPSTCRHSPVPWPGTEA